MNTSRISDWFKITNSFAYKAFQIIIENRINRNSLVVDTKLSTHVIYL